MNFSIDEFDYALPPGLIAQHPGLERAASRLLCVAGDALADRRFAELPQLLEAGDLLVLNDTRVIKARLFGEKDSGGRIEALIERVLSEFEALAQIRASKPPRPGSTLRFDGDVVAQVLDRSDDFYHLRFDGSSPVIDLLEQHGSVPLPPYIAHAPDADDERRYQTVYARVPGAVAAPTAGLHFDDALLEQVRGRGVGLASITLHVGAGTFQPVRTRDLAAHRMHSERYDIPAATIAAIAEAKRRGGRVVAVGTTTVRCLESAALRSSVLDAPAPGPGETDLFITPGFEFRVADRLITNFHLPKSTLLVLVSAFAGIEPVRRAYRHAIGERYRFYSYGDAMLVDKMPA